MKPLETEDSQHRVLILAPAGRDGALACGVLEDSGIPARVTSGLDELSAGIREGCGAVLLTEEVLQPAAIEELSTVFASQPPWSDVPVLVFSGLASIPETEAMSRRQLRALANVIFLDRPTRRVTLLSAVLAALRARRRQYEVRDLLVELERAVRSRDHFLAMLGHELRNPLGAILTSVQLMERKHPESAASERRIIHRQTDLLSRLVDDLLDVSRVTSGKITLERRTVDLAELLARCVSSHARAAKEAGVELTFSTQSAVSVTGDPVRLEQVIHNLLTNAIKYTPSGGRVQAALSHHETDAELRITDTGVGMGPEILPRVFDLFAQADETLDRAHGGLGIGLTLVRSLVDLHGGSVRAESSGRGCGSTFVVSLPAVAAGGAGEGMHEAGPTVASRRVLLVEDNADVRESLKLLLEEMGHRVTVAADGLEGIARGIAVRPDVALVDIGLPGLDGYGVARRLRESLGGSVYLVAVTGYGLPEDRRRAFEGGFDAHLTKPVTLRAVLDLLSRSVHALPEPSRAAQG